MGIDPLSVPQIRIAHESGLGNAHPESIDLRGDSIAHYIHRGFRIPPRIPTLRFPPFAVRLARDLLVPVIDATLCIGCGECVAACPTTPKSMTQKDGGVPVYDYAACIRCSCCQETCRHGAISLRQALLGPRSRRA